MIGFAAFLGLLAVALLALLGVLRLVGGRREIPLPPGEARRLDRLESALETLETRLEALQDEQRFLVRLLEDRGSTRTLEAGDQAPGDRPDSILFDAEEES